MTNDWPNWLRKEVKAKRRADTFGGYVWPSSSDIRCALRGDKPMTGNEVLDEVRWLMQAGEHPDMIAHRLNRTRSSIAKLAARYDQPDIAHLMEPRVLHGAKERRLAA